MEVFVVTGLNGPLKLHDGLTSVLNQRQESVALLFIPRRHGVPCAVQILGDKNRKNK